MLRLFVPLLVAAYVDTDVVGPTVVAGGSEGAGLNQLNGPRGVHGLKDGTLFVCDSKNHRVLKFAPDATEGTVVAGGNGAGDALNQLSSPDSLYALADGTLFVADRANHRVLKFAPGATEGTVVAGGNGEGSGLNQLSFPHGVSALEDGTVFVTDTHDRSVLEKERPEDFVNNQRVMKWLPGAAEGTAVAGERLGAGSGASDLNYPFDVHVLEDETLIISETFNHRIVKWAKGATSGTLAAGGTNGGKSPHGGCWGCIGEDFDQLSQPRGIHMLKDGTLFVADSKNHRVVKWPQGATSGTVVAGGNGEGSDLTQLAWPFDVYVSEDGSLFVADEGNHRVLKYTAGYLAQRAAEQESAGLEVVDIAGTDSGALPPALALLGLLLHW